MSRVNYNKLKLAYACDILKIISSTTINNDYRINVSTLTNFLIYQ